ncbi:MAG: hypothetical protein Q4D98_12315 [Planctomycetia bacterium]|nr:hypothetical protein [Planctomycetia bacterium]
MKRIWAWIVLFFLISPAYGEETYLLRYQWHKGDVLEWDVTHRNRTTTMVSETDDAVDAMTRSRKHWEVVAVDENGVGTIENTVVWADMREKNGDQPMRTFDSRKEQIPPEGFETVPESLGRVLAKISISPTGEQVSREDFHTSTIVQQANQAYVCVKFPEQAIPVGYSWSYPYPVYVPQPNGTLRRIEMTQKFTLEKVENGLATISYGTKVLSPNLDRGTLAQIMDRLYRGTFLFDITRGRSVMLSQKVDETVVGFRGEVSRVKMLIEFNERYLFQ